MILKIVGKFGGICQWIMGSLWGVKVANLWLRVKLVPDEVSNQMGEVDKMFEDLTSMSENRKRTE